MKLPQASVGDVLAPARHRQALAPAVAAAGVGDHHGVRAVRQQVGARAERVRRRRSGGRAAPAGCRARRHVLGLLDRRILERHQVRDPLLQQQLGRPGRADRRGSGAASAQSLQRVVEREQAHALVVRHVGRQRRRRRRGPSAAARRCSRSPRRSRSGRPCPRARRRSRLSSTAARRERRGQDARVRRDDQIVGRGRA